MMLAALGVEYIRASSPKEGWEPLPERYTCTSLPPSALLLSLGE
jgi:hypothetical protein